MADCRITKAFFESAVARILYATSTPPFLFSVNPESGSVIEICVSSFLMTLLWTYMNKDTIQSNLLEYMRDDRLCWLLYHEMFTQTMIYN